VILSLQFRALARFAVVWAIPWAGAGALLALLRWIAAPSGFSLGEALALHTTAFGALGLISGLDVGLILARAERGRRVDQLVPRRVALWGLLGGAAPAVLFALLGWAFGAPATVWAPLAGLGVVSAVISAGLATSVVTAAKPREPLPPQRGRNISGNLPSVCSWQRRAYLRQPLCS
jgi:MFS family permease